MRKSASLATSFAMLLSGVFLGASPASAMCALQYPTIGTIKSVSTDAYGNSIIALNNADVFSTAQFSNTSTNIDQYNALALAYKQNNYQVPPTYANLTSANFDRSNLQISVPTPALNAVSYNAGDIVIMGPPGGGACVQDGFVGFFGQNGTIQSAIAKDSQFFSYTYGSETLSLAGTTPQYGCTENDTFRTCNVSIQYSLNGNSSMLNPGDSKTLSGARFAGVSLITSTYATLKCQNSPTTTGGIQNCWMEDFTPQALVHVLRFNAATTPSPSPQPQPSFSASPTSGPAPLRVTFSALLAGSLYLLDFGDGSPTTQLSPATGQCINGPCQMTETHIYTSPGTYTVKLLKPLYCLNLGGCPPSVLGTVMIPVTGQNSGGLSISGVSGPSQLVVGQQGTWSVQASDSSGYLSYSVHWGDEAVQPTFHGVSASAAQQNTGTFTHAYYTAGTYTPTFTITNANGQNATASASVSVGGTIYPPNPVPPASCPVLYRNLSRGSRGSDVAALQNFFILIGLLTGDSATGYFGILTQGAVQSWQSTHGIISYGSPTATGWGAVGPRTRAMLNNCNS